MKYAVIMEGVSKAIKGKRVLRGINLRVPMGSIYVLAGPNGSGKTTTIRVLLGLVRRDSGKVEVLGVDPESVDFNMVKGRIGYLPEDAQTYERLTGIEHIVFYAKLYSRGSDVTSMVRRAIEITGLPESVLNAKTGTYSRGMKRRLLLSLTLMHNPELAILDEPLSGLDVTSAYRIKKLIKGMAGSGTTFIITTHDMRDAEELADIVGFIVDGVIVAEGSPLELMRETGSESLEEAYVKITSGGF